MKRLWSWAAAIALASPGCGGAGESGEDVDTTEAAVGEAPAPDPQSVSFGRDGKEHAYGIHIEDQAHQKPKVIYSVRLPDLTQAEQLRIRGEVTLSRCNWKDIAGLSGDAKITPCDSAAMKKDPYGYTPRFSARFVLADSANDTSGKQLSAWSDISCSEGHHHCALALPEAVAKDLPAAAEKFVNLIVTADAEGKNARSWDVMEVEQGHGELDVTRVAPGADVDVVSKKSTQLLAKNAMGIDQTEDEGDTSQVRHLLYQVELHGLLPGDVVDADARMRAVLGSGFSCDPLITAQLLITEDAAAKKPVKKADETLTAKNGHNCSDHSGDGCKYVESGATRLGKDAPSTMFVSYVVQAARSCAAPNGGDKWQADPKDGFLRVGVSR